MPTAQTILQKLPAFSGTVTTIKKRQSLKDIIAEIQTMHKLCAPHYDAICLDFLGSDEYATGENIFNFLKDNVTYNEESEAAQTSRTPAALILMGKDVGADCKNYAMFTGGILDALNRQGYDYDYCYRFATYPKSEHVFIVLNPETDDEIWIDAVMDSYDYKGNPPIKYFDKNFTNMALLRISGVGTPARVAPVYSQPYGVPYIPHNANGLTSTMAQTYGYYLANLQNDAQKMIDAGTLVEGSKSWQKYEAAIRNVMDKIARFETSTDWNFGKSIAPRKAVGGGLISTLYGSEQLQTMQQALPGMAMYFLYLYIPINDNADFYKRWCPQMQHDYKNVVPAIVVTKRNYAGQTSWHWGEWGGFSPDKDVYPLLYQVLTQQLGMAPEVFWSNALGLPITKQDNGVFSGLMSNDDVSPLASILNSTIKDVIGAADAATGGTVTEILTYAKEFLSGIIDKVEMLYPAQDFAPSVQDWVGSKFNPFPNGFPPKQGYFAPNAFPPGSTTPPGNPPVVPPGTGSSAGVLLIGGAAAFMLYKNSKHKA